MMRKARILRLEKAIKDKSAAREISSIWVSVVDPGGTLSSGWVDFKEYVKWHPLKCDGAFLEQTRNMAFPMSSMRHHVSDVTAFAECISLNCPWHGAVNRYLDSIGASRVELPRSTEELLHAVIDECWARKE